MSQSVGVFQTTKESLRLKMKFLRMDAYEKWKQRCPVLSKQFYKKEMQIDPLTHGPMMGVRVPKDEDGVCS